MADIHFQPVPLTVEDIRFHRNGVAGEPFHVVQFRDPEVGGMVGVVFDGPGRVAVFDRARLAAGDAEFGSNSWRGERYEPFLRAAVRRHDGEDTPPGGEGLDAGPSVESSRG